MPDYPPEAIAAAVDAVMKQRELKSEGSRQWAAPIVTAALDAAAPILAEAIAQKIIAHMENFGPHKPRGALEPVTAIGRDYRAWCRHFGIAARVAAGAFDTREDELRKAAEAIERGDFIACKIPEPES